MTGAATDCPRPTPAPATLDESVLDLEAVVDAAGLQRFALYAPSGGAAIAIRYAARHPQRVSQLITLGGFVRGMRSGAASARGRPRVSMPSSG